MTFRMITLLAAVLFVPAWAEDVPKAVEVADGEAEGTSTASVDSWYPRTVTSDKGTVIVYAPQIDAWAEFETISGWVAFKMSRTGSQDSYVGSIRFDAQTDTDVQEREVLLHDAEVHELTIDGLDEGAEEYALVKDAFSTRSRTVPLDLVLEYLPRETLIPAAEGLNQQPPTIFSSTGAAILLAVESEPVWVPVGEGDLQFVINTNWDVLRAGDGGRVYFCYQDAWLSAAAVDEDWSWASSLPEQFSAIPNNSNWSNVHDCLPQDLNRLSPPQQAVPTVFYSADPAELLLLEGEPQWAAIGDSGLSYAANTKQELFKVGQQHYFLISGRWFEATDLAGPWTMATELPVAFQDIPVENGDDSHAKSYVRKSVPGTQEAWEAALVASIPRKAQIVRGAEGALNLTVTYSGDPVFTPIETTDIEMAVNTSYQVFRYGSAYYLCHNAVWLTAFSANGPWTFADSIPEEFATIPPSSSAYNTTFVSVDGSSEEIIDYAYTSGYEGAYVSESTVVSGTGYASPVVSVAIVYGMYAGGWGYPYYPFYPWPPTYGYGSWYDPGTGRYGETIVGYGPYGAAAGTAVYNPTTGAYARGQAVWDSDEFAGRGYAYNPNTDTSIARNRYVDFDDNEGWSQGVAQRGDEWRYKESEWEDGRMKTEFESSLGTEGEVTRQKQGDTIVSEGSVTGENRSATFNSVIEDGALSGNIQGSEGGSGQVDRQLDEGSISGSGTFTKDGQTIETDVTRTAEGVQRDFETSGGAQGKTLRSGDDNAFVVESGSGDVYAGRDGNVYQKTDDGWTSVENRGAAERAGTTSSQLQRDYQSRQNGFDRYAQHQSGAAGRARTRNVGRGRRR